MFRTRFKKEIVAEFLPPSRSAKKQKLITLCDEMPSIPRKQALAEFLAGKGFWVIIRAIVGHGRAAVNFLRNRLTEIFWTSSTSYRPSLRKLLSVGASGLHRIRSSLSEEALEGRRRSCCHLIVE